MKIIEGHDHKIYTWDIETYKKMFCAVFYNGDTGEYTTFVISQWRNDLYKMCKFYSSTNIDYAVGYNTISFDSVVMEYILRNYHKWYNLSNQEIIDKIYECAQTTIENSNYGLFPVYREEELSVRQIDIFRLNHYDNKNRMVSLKRLEFEMQLERIEELPIPHDKDELTEEEVDIVVDYCKHDVYATHQFLLITIGDTEHPLYKQNNQIQLREDIKTEFNINCYNFSDSKIGDEIIKKFYCEEKGIQYSDLPKKGFFRKSVKLKNCIPSNVEFTTPELQKFLKDIKKIELKQNEDFVNSLKFYSQEYTFAKGGLHNVIANKIYEEDDKMMIIDADVASYYPAIIINNGYYPFHLGKQFLNGYRKLFNKRLELKPLAKKDKRIKGIVGGYKLSLNSVYGKSSDMQSWLYDKQLTLATCITGELSLLMLIEACELEGIKCIMANTDGISVYLPRDKKDRFYEICKEWMEKTKYELEYKEYKKMIFSTVNDYIAIETDSEAEIKYKGDFLIDTELHKNHSGKIIRLALSEYFLKGVNVEEYIKGHKNIFDFCYRQKASKDFHYEGIKEDNRSVYNKLIRYYISLDGEKILKIKNPSCQTNAAPISEIHAGEWLCTVCNILPKTTKIEDCNINYDFYINKTKEFILKIEKNWKKTGKKPVDKNQLSMF